MGAGNRAGAEIRETSTQPSKPVRGQFQIRRDFTEKQRRDFARNGYEEILGIFELNLDELQRSQKGVETDCERITAVEFLARIYVDGNERSACRVKFGADWHGEGISYGEGANPNSFSEFLVAKDDGFTIYLEPSGLIGYGDAPERLDTGEEAGAYLWEQCVRTLSQ